MKWGENSLTSVENPGQEEEKAPQFMENLRLFFAPTNDLIIECLKKAPDCVSFFFLRRSTFRAAMRLL